jgi:hypothetical protein
MQHVGILVHAPTLMLMMTNAAWARECVRKPTAMTATRSWQTLQIIVMMPHVQMVNVVVRQQHAQIMVAARMAHQCLQTMPALTATHQGHAKTATQMTQLAASTRAHRAYARAATRSWQSLQLCVLLPHVQRVNVVVRQQNAQIMVAARMAHQCLQTMPALTATHQAHAKTATQMTQLAASTRAHRAYARAATRSWQSLQLFVVLPHAQTQCVVVRQQNAQIMVVARRAR